MLQEEIEDILSYISNCWPLCHILPSRVLQASKRNIIDTCTNITTLSMLIELLPRVLEALEIDKTIEHKSKEKTKRDFFVISQIARLRRAELVYKKFQARYDKKAIIKEIKGELSKAAQPDPASSAKAYVESISSCLSQGFLPLPINALRYDDNDKGFQELLIVSFLNKKTNEDKIEFQFNDHEAFKLPSLRALEAVEKLLTEEQREILKSLKLVVRLRDYQGGYIDGGHHGTTDSIGLAMAVAIYFNFQLYFVKNNKGKLRQLRILFEKELENIALTGEIDDKGTITAISGIKQKVKAAENMEMKRVFCPAANKNEIQSESLSIIPINTLEQAIALVRYGQYLKKATEATLPCFVESSFSILTDKHYLSNVTFAHVVKRQAEIFGGDVSHGIDRFAERESFIPNQPKARVLEDFLKDGILITGDGGMGKTTFLHHLLQDYSDKLINGTEIKEFKGELKIPVYIELAKYKLSKELKDLGSLIKESLGEDLKDLSIEEINDELNNGRFILLLDGVNEIAGKGIDDPFHKEMQSISHKNLFILTSRGNTPINLPGFQRLELEKFDNEKIEKYIEDRLRNQPEKAVVLKKVFAEQHYDIGGNPFFLSLIVEDAEGRDIGEITEGRYRNRGKLLDRIVYKRFFLKSDRREAAPDEEKLELFKEIMPGLARHLAFEKGQIFFKKSDISEYATKTKKKTKVEKFLKILTDPNFSHIIRHFRGKEEKHKSWKFSHDIFFEYFVAVALQTEFLRLMAETGMMPRPELADYLQEYINKVKWEDFVMITVGLLVDCDVEPSGIKGKFGKIYCDCKEDGFFCREIAKELPREQRSCPREEIKSFQLTSEMLPPRG